MKQRQQQLLEVRKGAAAWAYTYLSVYAFGDTRRKRKRKMCVEPTQLGNGVEVGCRQCWQCRYRRVNDYVGRCIAEKQYASKTYAVTLTYGESSGSSKVTLVYKDVQDFLKRLRKKFKVRYLVVGEYGSAKNRAHWHVILFFYGKYPDPANMEQVMFPDEKLPENEFRVQWAPWSEKHGFCYFQEPDYRGFKYLMKYVLKDQDQRAQDGHIAMSTMETVNGKRVGAPLGYKYFEDLAHDYVQKGIQPKGWVYKFKNIRDMHGKIRKFSMQGKTRDTFAKNVRNWWFLKWGKPIVCDLLEEYFENEIDTDVVMEFRRSFKPVRYVEPYDMIVDMYDGPIDFTLFKPARGGFQIETKENRWLDVEKEVIEGLIDRANFVEGSVYKDKGTLKEMWNLN